MWAIEIQYEPWFAGAMTAIEGRGFRITIEEDRIVVGKRASPRSYALKSELEFVEFANLHGARVDPAVAGEPARRYRHGDIPDAPMSTEPMVAVSARARVTADELRTQMNDPASGGMEDAFRRLRRVCEMAIARGEMWENLAAAAEARVAELNAKLNMRQDAGPNRKFEQLKRVLAREFHPDHSGAQGIEKLIRAEMFKTVWPKVEEIERSTD
jgi:hypothetical protein